MAKLKNTNRSISIRLSINITLDDVGLQPLFKELQCIEDEAGLLEAIQIHALKRRHLLKILHDYCSGTDIRTQSMHAINHAAIPKAEVVIEAKYMKKTDVQQPDMVTSVLPNEGLQPSSVHSKANTDAINQSIAAGMGDSFGFN